MIHGLSDDFFANTQEVGQIEHNYPQTNNNVVMWGTLLPLKDYYPFVELYNPSYKIGRLGDCVLDPRCGYFLSISKVHFEITRLENGTIILKDLSQNGTFVNGVKVGKDQNIVLQTHDEIALACKMNRAYMFVDPSVKGPTYPPEVSSKYTITKKIGSGACGEVRVAFNNETHCKIAVKIITKKALNMQNKCPMLESEVNILRKLNHACIIQFREAIDTEEKLYIFLELVEGGELFDRVIQIKQFTEPEARVLFFQMVLAIQYLHDNNVSHRDLKPENILLAIPETNTTLIKVTDFGLSKLVDGVTMLKTYCGTPNYLAPEVLAANKGKTPYTFACDVWSLGVVLFICLSGYPPFTDERNDYELVDQITNGSIDFPDMFWGNVSKSAIDLIKGMLQVDPKLRITIPQILAHPWMQDKDMLDTVETLLKQFYGDKDGNNNANNNAQEQSATISERIACIARFAAGGVATDIVQSNEQVVDNKTAPESKESWDPILPGKPATANRTPKKSTEATVKKTPTRKRPVTASELPRTTRKSAAALNNVTESLNAEPIIKNKKI